MPFLSHRPQFQPHSSGSTASPSSSSCLGKRREGDARKQSVSSYARRRTEPYLRDEEAGADPAFLSHVRNVGPSQTNAASQGPPSRPQARRLLDPDLRRL